MAARASSMESWSRLDLALQELLRQPLQGRPVWRPLQDMQPASDRAHSWVEHSQCEALHALCTFLINCSGSWWPCDMGC